MTSRAVALPRSANAARKIARRRQCCRCPRRLEWPQHPPGTGHAPAHHQMGDPPRPPRPESAGGDLRLPLIARVRIGSPQRHRPAGLQTATTAPIITPVGRPRAAPRARRAIGVSSKPRAEASCRVDRDCRRSITNHRDVPCLGRMPRGPESTRASSAHGEARGFPRADPRRRTRSPGRRITAYAVVEHALKGRTTTAMCAAL